LSSEEGRHEALQGNLNGDHSFDFSSCNFGASTDFFVLTDFTDSNGAYPYGGLIKDSAGNLYGTTYSGGAYSAGTVFVLSDGVEQVLHSFKGIDGAIPWGD
jgi:uncharacterized repeat protein (TIGR03803 family)